MPPSTLGLPSPSTNASPPSPPPLSPTIHPFVGPTSFNSPLRPCIPFHAPHPCYFSVQVEYAALDAWASLAVYQRLASIPAAAALLASPRAGGCLCRVPPAVKAMSAPLPQPRIPVGEDGAR
jgi:hypothetical protein